MGDRGDEHALSCHQSVDASEVAVHRGGEIGDLSRHAFKAQAMARVEWIDVFGFRRGSLDRRES